MHDAVYSMHDTVCSIQYAYHRTVPGYDHQHVPLPLLDPSGPHLALALALAHCKSLPKKNCKQNTESPTGACTESGPHDTPPITIRRPSPVQSY
ncbi:hypothetical protein E2P81_ATG02722 [Venturia nashicola]|nr:hypothetical protein E2P81_ATG02722 [Venturia nashicola]